MRARRDGREGPTGMRHAGESVRRSRPPLLVLLATACVAVVAVLVVAGGALAPYDPARQDLLLGAAGPGGGHWLGTDALGRDVLSQVLAGARSAVVGPLVAAVGALLIGVPLGLAAGYLGGWTDALTNRFAELVYVLPVMLLVVVVVGTVGNGYWLAVAVVTLVSLPAQIRLCRGTTLVQARLPYVEAARTLGLPAARIMVRHILPNILPTVVTTFLLDFVGALIGLSGLSYLGLGVPPGTPDWGELLRQGQSLLTVNPYLSLAPGVMIIVSAVGVTLVGDWLYERGTAR
ncbi:ABC transporter permease [Streptomyces sp. 4F14]|uniref:ABC transporter permease n=1 Tax=Streptomyces sp. 4F14 TaxID=3394380 RepID=UPI003A842578